MYALVVRFDLKAERAAEFDALVASTLEGIAREEGTITYVPHLVIGEPSARIFYEVYRDRAAFLEHERESHVIHFLRARSELLAAPPRVEFLTELPPRRPSEPAQ